MTTKKPSRLAREVAEMADVQRRLGIMDEAIRDEALEHWLRTEVVASAAELKADPSKGRTPEQVLASLKAETECQNKAR